MKVNRFVIDGFNVKTTLDLVAAEALFRDVAAKNFKSIQLFKDDYRSRVELVEHSVYGKINYKIPVLRNHDFFERFRSLLRQSFVFRVFDSHVEALELGFSCGKPLLAAEKRRFGVCVDSFIVYEFVDGRPAVAHDLEDGKLVIPEMVKLFQLGIARDDPSQRNFLIEGERVHFIDFNFRYKLLGNYMVISEFLEFARNYPEAFDYLPPEVVNGWTFKLVRASRKIIDKLDKLKKAILRPIRGR